MMRNREAPLSRTLGKLFFSWKADARGPRHLDGLMAEENVRGMFETIAPSYDLQNRLLSMWLDTHWRNMFVRRLGLTKGGLLGDLAVGTGEIALRACRRYPRIRVIGVDFSPHMMEVARRKIHRRGLEGRIELRRGDLRRLPVDDGLFDAITIAFGIRNIAQRDEVLRDCFRALKPGGRIQVMEPGFLDIPVLGRVYRWYFDHVMPLIGNLLSGTDYAYTYLSETVYAFPSDEGFLMSLDAAGFVDTGVTLLTYGIARIYRGRKSRGGH
jgi:demethylmenaquinone methyltransferase / 2-methoxy-6-polyprenyl-1,4-benzoquinol methylase